MSIQLLDGLQHSPSLLILAVPNADTKAPTHLRLRCMFEFDTGLTDKKG
jgi:hypothetical protein